VAYEFRLPDLGEGVMEVELLSWFVAVGDQVAEDDPMCEVDTDKVAMEITCPVDGIVSALHAEPGDTVSLGALMITIEDGGAEGAGGGAGADVAGAGSRAAAEAANADATSAGPGAPGSEQVGRGRAPGGVKAAPVARRLARELEVDLARVSGSGPGGAITEADVRKAAQPAEGPDAAQPDGRREPLRGVRRRIAENLARSHREVPKVTVVEECDFTKLNATRGTISLVPFLLKATVAGLQEFAEFNATLDGDEVVFLERYDIGVAAQGSKGLVVPVVRAVDQLGIEELDAEVRRLAAAVRDNSLERQDLVGATFTVTSAGKLGGYFATPLVNHPEAAILGVHKITERPVVRGGEIVVREIALVSCSFDHRIADGSRATALMLKVIEELERGATVA
jgi:pyruvate/2-oxoglutarate dehydrogenase complex dihydrolipoamide acyltransferase (E2) component